MKFAQPVGIGRTIHEQAPWQEVRITQSTGGFAWRGFKRFDARMPDKTISRPELARYTHAECEGRNGDCRNSFPKGTKMKTIVLLLLSFAFSDMAFAQALECPPTPGAGDLLACYNRTPPEPGKRTTSRVTTALDKPAVSNTPTDPRVPADDMLSVENKKLDAKVKSLCRGC